MYCMVGRTGLSVMWETLACWQHLYPASMFISVDFPAPEGPMIATRPPLVNFPEIPFNSVL